MADLTLPIPLPSFMAIIGIGLDLVDLQRIAEIHGRHGDHFIRRICRDGECQDRRGAALIEHLGGLFAAKEAGLKALGTGWAQGLGFRQIEVVRSADGPPGLRFHAAAAERAQRLDVGHSHLSITHERGHAAAVVILER